MVGGLVPALDLSEACRAENLNEVVHVVAHVEVRHWCRSILDWFRLPVSRSLAPGSLCLCREEQRVLLATPYGKTCHRPGLENTEGLLDLVLWAVDQLQDQIRHVRSEPCIREGQGRATSLTPVDELTEGALVGHDLVEVDALTVRRIVSFDVKAGFVALNESVVTFLEATFAILHHSA